MPLLLASTSQSFRHPQLTCCHPQVKRGSTVTNALLLSSDGSTLITGGKDGVSFIWEVPKAADGSIGSTDDDQALPLAAIEGHTDSVVGLALSPDKVGDPTSGIIAKSCP